MKCIKIPVQKLFNGVTVRIISSLTAFSFDAELVFYFRNVQDFGCFLLYCLLANAMGKFQNILGQLCVFVTQSKKSLNGIVT